MTEESLFHEALAQPEHKRAAFLDRVCADQPQLRSAVASLLSAHAEAGDLLRPPAADTPGPGALQDSDPACTTDHERQAQMSAVPTEHPSRIGRYSILQVLGRGGMGAVYLAHDPELDRRIALKVPTLAGTSAEERFLREARAAAAVVHPHLCPVYDAGRAEGGLYLAMAYLPGATLTQVLKQDGPLAAAAAARLVAKVARGMAEAHRHGIVHRDLKPGNILLDSHGEPVVTDFGLALRADVPESEAIPTATGEYNPRLTQVGMLMGTPGYMPPEQACGDLDHIGPASDIYALGAILFELLTGRTPFQADNLAALVRKIQSNPAPAPSSLHPGISAELDRICQRALAKDPAERFESMDAFAETLTKFAAPRRRWGTAIAVAAAFFLTVIAGVIFYIKTDHGTVEVRLSDPAAKVEVHVDGNEIQLTEGGRVTKLRTGPHEMEVTGPDFETVTKLFKITRGKKTVVEVELKPAKDVAKSPKKDVPKKELPKENDRDKLAGLLAHGRKLIAAGQFDKLEPVANDALGVDPESPGALALRATFRYEVRKDRSSALADAEAALKLNPETAQALLVRAAINGAGGKTDEAIADLTIATRLDPKNPAVWMLRSQGYLAKIEFRQVVADATQAIEVGFLGPDALGNRAVAYGFLGEYEKALADFDVIVRLVPHEPRGLIQRSAVHAKLGNLEKSGADWAAVKKLVPNIPDSARLAIPDPPKKPERKKLSVADADALAKALKQGEQDYLLRRSEDARKCADEACRIDPTSAAAHSLRARLLAQSSLYNQALIEAEEAIRLDPTNAWAYTVRGAVKSSLKKDHAGAIADQSIALRMDSTLASAWYNRGNAYVRRGQYHQAFSDLNEALRRRPDFQEAFASRGACFLRFAEYDKALAEYTRAAELQPTNPSWRRICAALYVKLGQPDEAQKQRELADKIDGKGKDPPDPPLPPRIPPLKKDPEPPPDPQAEKQAKLAGLLTRGEQLIRLTRFAEVGPIADEALQLDAESPGALAQRATFRAAQNDIVRARADVEAALKLNPETYRALMVLAHLDSEQGKLDEPIVATTTALRLEPKDALGWRNRGSCYFRKGEYQQAIADATRAIELGFVRETVYIDRGATYACLGEYDKALADYDTAVKMAPSNAAGWVQRSAVHAKMGNVQKSTADWDKAKELIKTLTDNQRAIIPDPPRKAERKKLTPEQVRELATALTTAEKAWSQDRFEDCGKSAEDAARIDPTSAVARSLRACVWAIQGRYQEAIKEANEALRLNPDDARACTHRGLARNRLKDNAGAIADYTIALRLDPKNATPWNNRGFAYMNRGQYHQAIADLDEAIRLKPNYGNALTNRGECYLHLAEYDKALADYETATKVQPKNARWWHRLALVRGRLGDTEGSRREHDRAVAIDPQLANAARNLPVPLPPSKRDPEPGR